MHFQKLCKHLKNHKNGVYACIYVRISQAHNCVRLCVCVCSERVCFGVNPKM